jgi:hypothetical protein
MPNLCLGTITIPQLPAVMIGQESRSLRIELGIRAKQDMTIIMKGMGLQVIQGDATNYKEGDASFAEKVQTFAVEIFKDELAADISIIPHALGRFPVTFEVGQPANKDFVALDDLTRVLFGLSCA